jgi:hypothetical protein
MQTIRHNSNTVQPTNPLFTHTYTLAQCMHSPLPRPTSKTISPRKPFTMLSNKQPTQQTKTNRIRSPCSQNGSINLPIYYWYATDICQGTINP